MIKEVLSFYGMIVIPLLYIFNIFLIYRFPHTFTLPIYIRTMGLVMVIAGLVFWLISFFTLGLHKSFGILPRKQKRVKTGIYKYFKHPMYIGIWLTFTGLSIASESKEGLMWANFVIVPLSIIRAYFEEKYLQD